MIDKPLSYYKWFWQDFRANRKVQRMNYIERGLYRELLDECWADGSLPDDISELAEICGCPNDVMANAWQVLGKCFIDRGDGRLVNEKLESLRTDTDKTRLARAESGKKGALAKQMPSNSLANASNCHIEEKRREEDINTEKPQRKRSDTRHIEKPESVDTQVWEDWIALRKAKRAPVTKTVVDGAIGEAMKAGLSIDAFLRIWCRRGSQGLEASWLSPGEISQSSDFAGCI